MERSSADERWRVPLPDAAHPPLEVFVNGVPQAEGRDYSVEPRCDGRALAFARPLQKEGQLGFWRWTLMFFAIVGTYRKDDSVDVRYRIGDETRLATGLEIVAPNNVERGRGA